MNKGLLSAALAYLLWGLFPLYWRLLQHVPATEILAHRMVWSLVFLVLLLTVQQQWGRLLPAFREKKLLLRFAAAGLLLSANWGLYIWGVNSGQTVETSLGYFINPLVNVALGMIVLGERLRPGQWAAVLIAFAGVLWLTMSYGRIPWIALALGFSFGFYGLLKKQTRVAAVDGLTLETGAMALPMLGYLVWLGSAGTLAFGSVDLMTTVLLAAGGVVTSIPLLLFAWGAQRVRLATLGILQYAAPTLQFLIAVFVFREPFPAERWIGFGIIWLALLIYSAETLWYYRQHRPIPAPSG
jgi:chloramphenicol-sensitive protein RarD